MTSGNLSVKATIGFAFVGVAFGFVFVVILAFTIQPPVELVLVMFLCISFAVIFPLMWFAEQQL